MGKKILFLLFCILNTVYFILFIASPAHAADNFATSYNIVYTVGESGLTHALLKVGLTNNTGEVYATSYKVEVGFPEIENVKASDPDGVIHPIVTKNGDGNTVQVAFNSKVAGRGKTLHFTLAFDTPDIAHKQGSIWEINIPGIADQKDFEEFNVRVVMPKSFGKPAYTKPELKNDTLLFTKDDLKKSGISLAFGDKQIYGFNLTYFLQNKNLFPIQTELALPPSTNYQDVSIDSLDPKPDNVLRDDDGNWLAQYRLGASSHLTVSAKGKAAVYLLPKQEALADDQLKAYLAPQPFWQVDDKSIAKLTKTLRTPEQIYDYVVQTLSYDFSRVDTSNANSRLGALKALQEKNTAVCLEFTDLFVTLARAAGIPAREVDGYAYSQNKTQRPLSLQKDILHAWPEYYDKTLKTWVMVDPTWGNTTGGVDYFHTLDFDHLTFVVKGQDSEYPVPPGGYKKAGDSHTKDVEVTFADSFSDTTPTFSLGTAFSKTYFSGFPIKGAVTVTNSGHVPLPQDTMNIISSELTPQKQEADVDAIPPFGHATIDVHFDKTSILTNKTFEITIRVADKAFTKRIIVTPLLISDWRILGGLGIGILTIIILVITLKARRLRLSR